jgi:hypothetical protein
MGSTVHQHESTEVCAPLGLSRSSAGDRVAFDTDPRGARPDGDPPRGWTVLLSSVRAVVRGLCGSGASVVEPNGAPVSVAPLRLRLLDVQNDAGIRGLPVTFSGRGESL